MTTADPITLTGLTARIAHARAVPVEARESFGDAVAATANGSRSILLRTCHRVELYAVDGWPAGGSAAQPAVPAGGLLLEGSAAARHLLTVAAGLDSVVMGEDQILHQLRSCLADRRGAAPLDPTLERAFQLALQVGRRTRSWRAGPPRSLADVALDRIDRLIRTASATGPHAGRRLLVVGAGRMARLTALAASRRDMEVSIANRGTERASALAAEVRGRAVDFGVDAELPQVDAIVLAIGGPWPLGPAARQVLVEGRTPVVDLSSPPALDGGLRAELGSCYASVDDLADGGDDQVGDRERRRIDAAVEDALTELTRWVSARTSVPAIRALADRAEARRADELERLFRRTTLAAADRALVEQMSHRLVAGLLHAPISTLRDDETGELERAARELFAL